MELLRTKAAARIASVLRAHETPAGTPDGTDWQQSVIVRQGPATDSNRFSPRNLFTAGSEHTGSFA
jgi:hypothetical protein